MNLAVHDRLGDLQKNFVDGREMIELATRVLKSHVQSRSAQHLASSAGKASNMGSITHFKYRIVRKS